MVRYETAKRREADPPLGCDPAESEPSRVQFVTEDLPKTRAAAGRATYVLLFDEPAEPLKPRLFRCHGFLISGISSAAQLDATRL